MTTIHDAFSKVEVEIELEISFVAARTAADQVVDLGIMLMYLGVPLPTMSYIFGL